jgi:outer membrane lipoprotein-sorting protein
MIPSQTRCLLGVWLVCAAAGCGHPSHPARHPDPQSAGDPRVVRWIASLQEKNTDVRTFKGVGTIRQVRGGQVQSYRAAWIGTHPDRLRLVILAAGRPAVKIATDGKWVTLLDPFNDRKPYRRFAFSQHGIETVFGQAVRFSDLIDLLAGRYPIHPFDTAVLRTTGDGEGVKTVALKRSWKGVAQTVELEASTLQATRIVTLGFGGEAKGAIRLGPERRFGDRSLPERFSFRSADGAQLSFRIDRYEDNVDVPPYVFTLPDPAAAP